MGVISLLRSGKGPMDGWVARAYDRGVQAVFRDIFPQLVEDLLDELRGIRRGLDVGCGRLAPRWWVAGRSSLGWAGVTGGQRLTTSDRRRL